MKKVLSIFLACVCLAYCCISVSATDAKETVITVNNVDVIFDSSSSLTPEQQQIIATFLVNGESNIQPYGLICNLLGHNSSTEIVTSITHCVSSTAPRCLREKWEIVSCSRCGDIIEQTRLNYALIYCCSE